MTSLLFMFSVLISTSILTGTTANRLGRIENKLRILDRKLNTNAMEISALKTDVADTNRKLDLLIEIINGTQTAQPADDTKDDVTNYDETKDDVTKDDVTKDDVTKDDDTKDTSLLDNGLLASQSLSMPIDVEMAVRVEISRVRRAFASEKKKLSSKQKRNQAQFIKFAKKLDKGLTRLDDVFHTCSNSLNESVTSVLGTVRDEMELQLIEWQQTIHDHLNGIGDEMHSRFNTLTNNMQHKVISTLSKINETVDSMDFSDKLSQIATNLQLHDSNTESSFNKIHQLETERVASNTTSSIQCRELPPVKLPQVRLAGGGSTAWRGRFEMLVDGKWGTICDDGFGEIDATIACRMLGFKSGVHKEGGYFGEGTGDILMNNVNCEGTERSLLECPHNDNVRTCSHREDVGVICS